MQGEFNQKTDYSATVYISSNSNGYTVNLPEVKLTLSGMPANGFTASMVFPNSASSSYNRTYEFTSNNQTVGREIGGNIDGNTASCGVSANNPKIFPAGNHTVASIEVVYGQYTLDVTLAHPVTINQPQIPRYVDFQIDNNSYTGNIPARVYTMDGESVTFTLPSASQFTAQWNEAMVESTKSNLRTISDTVTEYYETWTSCGNSRHQKYTKHVTVTQEDEIESTYTRTWKITGWRVGNTIYGLDHTEPITVNGTQTVSAVIEYTDGDRITRNYVLTTTTKYYDVGPNNQSGEPPAGYLNVETDPDNGNKDRWTANNPNVEEVYDPPKN